MDLLLCWQLVYFVSTQFESPPSTKSISVSVCWKRAPLKIADVCCCQNLSLVTGTKDVKGGRESLKADFFRLLCE